MSCDAPLLLLPLLLLSPLLDCSFSPDGVVVVS
jgi:hypothetical protein